MRTGHLIDVRLSDNGIRDPRILTEAFEFASERGNALNDFRIHAWGVCYVSFYAGVWGADAKEKERQYQAEWSRRAAEVVLPDVEMAGEGL